MKKKWFIIFFLFIVMTSTQSSESLVLSYQKNFIKASIDTKIEILDIASKITDVNMFPLYNEALEFAITHYPLLQEDSQLIDIAVISIEKLDRYQNGAVLPLIQRIFESVPEPRVQIACFDFLASYHTKNIEINLYLSSWLEKQIQNQTSGTPVNNKVVLACIESLENTATVEIFDVLFSILLTNFDSNIEKATKKTISNISEGFYNKILGILNKKNIQEAYMAFLIAMNNNNLSSVEKGTIAVQSFDLGLHTNDSSAHIVAKKLLQESLTIIKALSWSNASPLLVKYFYQIQLDYKNNKTDLQTLTHAIDSLGAMGTSEAAEALSIFLGLLNSEMEQKKMTNETLLLSVINALGELGDKTAFDYLVYVSYLDYSESVKKASRDALARLKW